MSSSLASSGTSSTASSIATPSTSTRCSIPVRTAGAQRQSVAVHLVGLCHWLEHGLTAAELNPMTQALASSKAGLAVAPAAASDLT